MECHLKCVDKCNSGLGHVYSLLQNMSRVVMSMAPAFLSRLLSAWSSFLMAPQMNSKIKRRPDKVGCSDVNNVC